MDTEIAKKWPLQMRIQFWFSNRNTWNTIHHFQEIMKSTQIQLKIFNEQINIEIDN